MSKTRFSQSGSSGISASLATDFYPYAHDMQAFTNVDAAMKRIIRIYKNSCKNVHKQFQEAIQDPQALSKLTSQEEDSTETALQTTYPYIGLRVDRVSKHADSRFSYGVALEPGVYGTTITRPDIFEAYYREQIDLLMKNHQAPILVGISSWPIPLPFVVDQSPVYVKSKKIQQNLKESFIMPDLSRINDAIANCTNDPDPNDIQALSLFSAERVDFSLHRLHHYTSTLPDHFQQFVLLTNYQRYADQFIEYAKEALTQKGSEFTEFIEPGNVTTYHDSLKKQPEGEPPSHLPQMPAYHLKRADGQGITFINMGVGPSNAKTITDHLAVLRPHCWILLGHCAGLRSSQVLGDYVLPHGYVREDHVLNDDLPPWVPIPPIAEVQQAFQQAVSTLQPSGQNLGEDITEMRTGTVVTTDNRNWELRSRQLYKRFKQSRAIALDMESATVAGNGFRFRVPYGVLLCVSDKPIHGEIKLHGTANKFYRDRVKQHLKVGLETIRIIRTQGVNQLHSRKLRGFVEPPFR